VVDESALTCEDTPLFRMVVDPIMRDDTTARRIENRQDLGFITTHGSFTTRGELLTEVLSYHRHKFKFDNKVKLVLFILTLEAVFMVAIV
jgi:hypothetical protein